jgi:arylsulfatase A-like enzyme
MPTVSRRSTSAFAALLLLLIEACAGEPPRDSIRRLVDDQDATQPWLQIGGTKRRVLDRSKDEHVIPVESSLRSATLDFWVGGPSETTVRFQIFLREPDAGPSLLYEREVVGGEWIHHEVKIDRRAGRPASLQFRRSLVRGKVQSLSFAGWGNPLLIADQERAASKMPSVILISLDTLRADRVGAYGHAPAKTPALDVLAASGVMFERAYSPSAWTLPSHASLLYGLYPLSFSPGHPDDWRMPDFAGLSIRPLPEILRERGYLTVAFTGGGFMSPAYGFHRGFDEYFMYNPPPENWSGKVMWEIDKECGPERFDGHEVFARAEEWIGRNRERPFFLFVHTYETHDKCPFTVGKDPLTVRPDPGPVGRRAEFDYYDELIARADRLLDGLLSTLDKLNLAEEVLVIVTSDHGEAFWEHGFEGHGREKKLYEELVRVPLIFRWPGRLSAGRRVPEPVSLIDVAPSILALLGVPAQPWMHGRTLPGLGIHFPGRDVLSAVVFRRAQGDALPGLGIAAARLLKPVFVQCDDLLVVRTARFKLLTSRNGDARDGEFYDLTLDPAETENVADDIAIVAPSLKAELENQAASYWAMVPIPLGSQEAPSAPDAATRERLRALGYVE